MASERNDTPPGNWTVGALYEHFSALFAVLEQGIRELIAEQEKQRQSAFSDLQAQIDRRLDVTLRERQDTERHLISEMQSGDQRLETHIDAQRDAVNKAEANMDKRLDALNKLREAVETDRHMFVRREEVNVKMDALEKRLDKAERDQDRRAGAEQHTDRRRTALQPWAIWAAGATITVLITLMVIGANLITATPGP